MCRGWKVLRWAVIWISYARSEFLTKEGSAMAGNYNSEERVLQQLLERLYESRGAICLEIGAAAVTASCAVHIIVQ